MDLQKVRAEFPHTEDTIYMNHAALAPMSRPVVRAIKAYVEERHKSNIENFFDFQPVVNETLEFAGNMLSAPSSQIAFAPNTSYGLNMLALGLGWQQGDRIIVPGCEFPANVYPFMQLKSRGVQVDLVPHLEGVFSVEDVEALITPRTKLLSVSWVQFLSGYRIDLKELGALCKSRKILFCVDAIQGLGALEIDVEACQIDFLASGCHKWLMAMQGIGLVYAAQPLLEQLEPFAGWLHGPVDWERLIDYNLVFHNDARRFRLGTENAMGVAALNASLRMYLEAGPTACEVQILELVNALRQGLLNLGFEIYGQVDPGLGSGIVTVKHDRANELYDQLKERSIHLAVRNGMLRFAPTYYNTLEEVEQVLETLRALLS